ncbi:MAG: class II fructose-bisphosphate aldolase [Thermosediminibacteraceae bacterium]|nr:class II fructose-bisphosphate aldolase [Thermosediminibacteraceae bacterium]
MSLVPIKDMLEKARAEKYAVPAFDVCNLEFIRAVVEVAEEKLSPVILMVLPHEFDTNLPYLVSMARTAAEQISVPIALHLDHSPSFELCKAAIDAGFSSVMIDGSTLPYEENVKLTRKVVEYAKPKGVSVEAELGHVGKAEANAGEGEDEGYFTDPEDVPRFIEETGVDALAVAIGTAHGIYTREPKLDIQRLAAINRVSSVPLVLHGGSGTPDDQVKEAIANGISKLNIFSELCVALVDGLKDFMANNQQRAPLPSHVFEKSITLMKDVVRCKIDLCGSAGKGHRA